MKAAIAAYKEKVRALEENNEILEKKNNYANSQLDQREVEILRKTQGEGNESAMSLKIQNEQL